MLKDSSFVLACERAVCVHSLYSLKSCGGSHIYSSRWSGGEHLFEFDWEEEGWALIRGWALINFFCLEDGRLFEVGANSRLGAYSNKYGIFSR